jgi:hypothetical protein
MHLRTVRSSKHKAFADEHNMAAYTLSAKTGDKGTALTLV